MGEATCSAPGKVILTGEHFVVYGARAIAGAIDLRAYATASTRNDGVISIFSEDMGISAEWRGSDLLRESKRGVSERLRPLKEALSAVISKVEGSGLTVNINSQIPRASGLGSSAAVAVSCVAAGLHAYGYRPSPPEIINFASIAEGIIHYRASGVDLAVSTYGGVISYRRGSKPTKIEIKKPISLLLIDVGTPRRTGDMVRHVSLLREQYISVFEKIRETVEEITSECELALINNRYERLGDLLMINHNLLRAIGVSTKELDNALELAIRSGAIGGKLTGGGGGGCVIAVVHEKEIDAVYRKLLRTYSVYKVTIPQDGVRCDSYKPE
ncbi:MAG: mevalonate kinase [Nitrososphaerota archaeon]